jgi:hypothetical protein
MTSFLLWHLGKGKLKLVVLPRRKRDFFSDIKNMMACVQTAGNLSKIMKSGIDARNQMGKGPKIQKEKNISFYILPGEKLTLNSLSSSGMY